MLKPEHIVVASFMACAASLLESKRKADFTAESAGGQRRRIEAAGLRTNGVVVIDDGGGEGCRVRFGGDAEAVAWAAHELRDMPVECSSRPAIPCLVKSESGASIPIRVDVELSIDPRKPANMSATIVDLRR